MYEVFFTESFKGIKLSKIQRYSRERGKHKEGLYYIQDINLKKCMNRFNCIAIKYISNYIK